MKSNDMSVRLHDVISSSDRVGYRLLSLGCCRLYTAQTDSLHYMSDEQLLVRERAERRLYPKHTTGGDPDVGLLSLLIRHGVGGVSGAIDVDLTCAMVLHNLIGNVSYIAYEANYDLVNITYMDSSDDMHIAAYCPLEDGILFDETINF